MQAKAFRRVLSFMIALALILSVLPVIELPVSAATTNLIPNGNFNSLINSDWSLGSSGKFSIQRSVARGGRALKFQAENGNYVTSGKISVTPGKTYVLSCYVRVDEAKGLEFSAFINDHVSAATWWKDFVIPSVENTTDGEWVEMSAAITVPATAGNKLQLGLRAYSGTGTLYVDDVSMVEVPSSADANLHFETLESGSLLNWSTLDSDITIGYDNSVYHDGSRSMYIEKTSLDEYSTVFSGVPMQVTAGNTYELSYWVSSQNVDPTATIQMNLQPSDIYGVSAGASALPGTVSALNGGSTRSGWKKVTSRITIPEGVGYVTMDFKLTRGAAKVWVDDIFFNVVENGVDCVASYDDFHAVDESGNISTWKTQGSAALASENGGKLTLSGEGYMYSPIDCMITDAEYCIKGDYTATVGGTAQIRFYDYMHNEYTGERRTTALQTSGGQFAISFTAPSHTYAMLYIGGTQAGTVTVEDVTVYCMSQPAKPNRNYLDADWSYRADRDNVVSSVEVYNGIPTLMIDGQPTASHFYLRPDLNAYLQTDAESRMEKSGIDLYVTYGGSLYKGGCDPIWLSDGSIDYSAFDAVIYDTLAANDDALVMVNFGMFAPQWWLDQNPTHQLVVHNGSEYIAIDGEVSMASEKFRQEAGEVLRKLIQHMKEQPYYNRVFGIKISGGQSYEWMIRGTGANQGPDYSEISKAGFKTYLQNRYGTVAALQSAWGNSNVTFETASAPDWNERSAFSNIYMGDADTGALSRNIVDWNLYLNEASADTFLYYCQIAKEETDNQIIVGGYNGYLWTSNTYDSQGMAHTAMDRVLDSEYVDWIASPIAYNERLLGQSSTYMAMLDTVQAHGKLFIAEQDNRTCLSDTYVSSGWNTDDDFSLGNTHTMSETIYQQKRDFANALVNGAGLWQFDMYGGWLDDDQIYDYIRDAKAEYDFSVNLYRDATNDVAVFVGDETYAYLTAENNNMSFRLLEPMLQQQRKHLAAMGAGYDTYAMSTLLEGKVPSHKLNIILSPFEITAEMKTAIDTHLKKNNQVVVWIYLPGISTGNALSAQNMKDVTGFDIAVVEELSSLKVKLTDSGHTITNGIADLVYGNSSIGAVSPMTYISDTAGCTVLGYNTDNETQAGFAVKDMGTWTSVYSSAPCLDVRILRNLMSLAGCHSYNDSNDNVIYSSNHYVALHSATGGQKTVNLPGNYSVYDVFGGQFISMNTNTITYNHEANDTRIFRLMSPNTYAVTAQVTAGKGTLSAPGLTEVAAGGTYTLNVTPENGYRVKKVTANGAEVALTDGGLSLPDISVNTVINVEFEQIIIVENGSMETGTFGGSISGSGGAAVVSDGTVHTGTHSLRLNYNDGNTRDLIKISIKMDPATVDRTVTVKLWGIMASGATQNSLLTSGISFTADYSANTGSAGDVYGAFYPVSTWKEFTKTYTLPAGYSEFQYQLYTGYAGTDLYVDDISISCDGVEMMVNGGFERGNFTGSYITGSFENSPEIIRSQFAHTGTYAAKVPQNGVVNTTVSNLDISSYSKIKASYYVSGTDSGNVYWRAKVNNQTVYIASGSTAITADGNWYQQTVEFVVPDGTDTITLELFSQDSTYYVDDIALSAHPMDSISISFQQVYTDGTWRFTSDDLSVLTQSYYKIPVVLDGQESYIVAGVGSDMLQVYPSFFGVYGGNVPSETFVIPQGAVVKAVSPAAGWEEVTNANVYAVAEAVDLTCEDGTWGRTVYPTDITMGLSGIASDGTWQFTTSQTLAGVFYRMNVTVDGTQYPVLVHNSGGSLLIYTNFFEALGGKAPTESFMIAENAVMRQVDPDNGWGEVSGAEAYAVSKELNFCKLDGIWTENGRTLDSCSVILNSVLGVRFYTKNVTGTVKVAVGDGEAVEIEASVNSNKPGYREFRADVFAQNMMKPITATLYDENGQVLHTTVFRFSDYVSAVEDLETVSQETKALAKASMTYCQYAAKLKGNDTGEMNVLAEIPENAFDSYPFKGSGTVPAGTSIHCYLDEACELRMRMTTNEYTVMINGTAVTPVRSGNTYVYSAGLILAQNYDVSYTFEVYQGEERMFVGSYSVLSYLGRALQNGNAQDVQNLLTAMYHYYAAADAYIAAS